MRRYLLSLRGFDSIHDQINEDLLDLNLIDRDRREGLVEVALDGYGALFRVLLHNSDNFIEYVRNLDIFLDEGLLLEECSNMLHSLVSRTGISYSPFNRRIHLRHIRRSGIQPPLRRLRACKYRHEWLVHVCGGWPRRFG